MNNRVGVITYWGIYNIGSYLQAFALQQLLIKNGYNPCIIQIQSSNFSKIKSKLKLLIKLIFNPLHINDFFELRRMGLRTINDVPSDTRIKFENDQKLVDTLKSDMSRLRRLSRNDEFIAFICGSDQIWNPLGFDSRDYKYLSFAPKHKRVAYAPSFGIDYVPSYNRKSVIKGLIGMRSISVRERQGAKLIEQLIGEKVQVVLDPTLLLTKEEWQKWESDISLPDDYVVFFFLSQPDDETIKEVKRLGVGKKIVCFHKAYALDGYDSAITMSIGPRDFLSVINKASVVCTDSFHAVAISTIYSKPLVVFRRTHKNTYNQFCRIENLLELTHNEQCIYGTDGYKGPSVSDNTNIDIEKEKSITYLMKAIKNE